MRSPSRRGGALGRVRGKRLLAAAAIASLAALFTLTGALAGSRPAKAHVAAPKGSPNRWPAAPQEWLADWSIWQFRGHPQRRRPKVVPTKIPKSAWEFLRWAAWQRDGAGLPRPKITQRVPLWAWDVLSKLDHAVQWPCGVDRASMTAPGCTTLRDDTASRPDALTGLWGELAAVGSSRYAYRTDGGDSNSQANGKAQGDSAYRELTVDDNDDYYGERAELGRNESRFGENSGSETDGTFALFHEGDHKIIFFSERYADNFDMTKDRWQVVFQVKQAEPYAANGPVDSSPAFTLNVYGGKIVLDNFWNVKWTTKAPPHDTWVRYALDVTFSKDPAKGKIRVYVDRNGDGDFTDTREVSPVITGPTLAFVTEQAVVPAGDPPGPYVGDPIPGHMRIGIYHDPSAYGTTTVDFDNVQVVG
jgi:hypothetical protein